MARTVVQDAFSKALSLGPMRDKPVADKDLGRLALEVVRDLGGMAADAGPVLERALEKLSDHLSSLNLDPDDLNEALELANSVANAAQRDEDLAKADAIDAKARRARDAEAAEERSEIERRKQAMDARPSQLDRLLAGVPNPGRPIAAR